MRYAVAGLGHLAQIAVLPAFKQCPNAELVALVSGDPLKQKKLGAKYDDVCAGISVPGLE